MKFTIIAFTALISAGMQMAAVSALCIINNNNYTATTSQQLITAANNSSSSPVSSILLTDLFWPLPESVARNPDVPLNQDFIDIGSSNRLSLSLSLSSSLSSSSSEDNNCINLIHSAFTRSLAKINSKCGVNNVAALAASFPVHVQITLPHKVHSPADLVGIDESYSIQVSLSSISITAQTAVGAIHAFETLSQMFLASTSTVSNAGSSCFVAALNVQDSPRFSHRGLMLDTARNFFPVADIKRHLDGMATSKLNIFHWHLYDAQSFPIAWEHDGGKLYKAAAYRTDLRDNTGGQLKVYTQTDIQGIVQYAFDRGIRVIPEFDMPGHTAVFGNAYPEIMKCMNFSPFDGGKGASSYWTLRRCAEPPCGQFDPESEKMYLLVDSFLSDMAKWFPDPVMHLGMDEVNAMCWDQPENNLNLVTAPMAKFARRVIDIVQRNGKQLMAWDEVVASYNLSNSPLLHGQNILPTNAIVQVWEDPSGGNINPSDAGVPLGSDPIQNMVQIVSSLGYSVVASPSNAWYLDCSPQAPWCADKDSNGNPTWHRWEKVYDYDPTSGISKFEHVIGGEVAMWSETLKADNIDYMIWPRAAAAAERLWSPASAAVRNPHTQLRLDRFRASLINELGIGAAPTTDTVGFPSSTKLFYRVEWCDFNLDTPAQKSSDVYAGMKPDSLPLSDYCGIASLYDTDTIIRSPPSRISYPF